MSELVNCSALTRTFGGGAFFPPGGEREPSGRINPGESG